MDAKLAEKRGLQPLGLPRLAVAGCEPDEWALGDYCTRLLGAKAWRFRRDRVVGLNEAFAVQTLYCRNKWDSMGVST